MLLHPSFTKNQHKIHLNCCHFVINLYHHSQSLTAILGHSFDFTTFCTMAIFTRATPFFSTARLFLSIQYLTLSTKTRIVCTSMLIEKKNKQLFVSSWKIFTRIDVAGNQWRKLQINKPYIPSYSPGYGEFKNYCFIFVAWTVSVSHAFVYNAVDLNKITTAFLAKPPP